MPCHAEVVHGRTARPPHTRAHVRAAPASVRAGDETRPDSPCLVPRRSVGTVYTSLRVLLYCANPSSYQHQQENHSAQRNHNVTCVHLTKSIELATDWPNSKLYSSQTHVEYCWGQVRFRSVHCFNNSPYTGQCEHRCLWCEVRFGGNSLSIRLSEWRRVVSFPVWE